MPEFIYQVNTVNNNLYFIGEINIQSVNDLLQQLHKLEANKNNTSANLYITSDGGCTRQGLKLFDILQNTELELTIYAIGFISSAATVSLFTKHKTIMYTNSILAFHELFNSQNQRYSNAKASLSLCDILMDKIISIYSNKNSDLNKEWLIIDKYLTAEEALEMKIVDEVI